MRNIKIFPLIKAVAYAPRIEPGIMVIRRSQTFFQSMSFAFSYFHTPMDEDTRVMGSGLPRAMRGGIEKRTRRNGVLMELPPNPNNPERNPMRTPSRSMKNAVMRFTNCERMNPLKILSLKFP